jgi:uncharacterized membrane protein YjjB (DUF3815 family)
MILKVVMAIIGTSAFAYIFNAPKKAIIPIGLIGGVGWTIFLIGSTWLGMFTQSANFFASLTVSFIGMLIAKSRDELSNIYIIPSLLPLVPGFGVYNGMNQIVNNEYNLGMSTIAKAGTDAVAIALGLLLVTSIFKVVARIKKNNELKN